MIKRKIILYLLLLVFINLVGCDNSTEEFSNENSILRTENENLNSEIEKLKNEIEKNDNVISEYESKIKDLENNIGFSNRYNEYDEQRMKEAFEYLKKELISTNTEEESIAYKNLFEPDFVSKGDVLGDSVVVDTYITDNHKSIIFEGEYQVTATYVYTAIGNILYIDNFEKQIPYTMYDINRSHFACQVSNQEEFIDELGEYFKEELEYGVKVKAVFKNLNYNILYESDMYSSIEFVELIEIVEE